MERIQKLVVTLGAAAWLAAGPVASARAQSRALDAVVDGVQDRYQKTHFFQARFQQTSTLASLGEKQESRGRVFIRKPGMMRWVYESPEKQLLVSDGLNYWVYTPRQKQVIMTRFGDAFRSKTPLAFLAGNGKIRDEFNIRFAKKPPKAGDGLSAVHRLVLTPKAAHPGLKEILLEVRKEDFLIVRSALIDPFGNITDIRFEEIRVDKIPPLELFTFQIPPGVEVVRPPRLPGSSQ